LNLRGSIQAWDLYRPFACPKLPHMNKKIPSRRLILRKQMGPNTPPKASSKNRATKQKSQSPASGKSTTTKKKTVARPGTSAQYFALAADRQETWNRAVHVIAKMRSEGISLTKASREFGLAPKAVLARAGSALRKTKSGRYAARPSDKLLRILLIPSPEGLREVVVKDSATASKIAVHNDAIQKFLRTGDSSGIKTSGRLKLLDANGKRIKLITDLAELQRLGSAGALSFESLYARTT
jgi:hypothetical protein